MLLWLKHQPINQKKESGTVCFFGGLNALLFVDHQPCWSVERSATLMENICYYGQMSVEKRLIGHTQGIKQKDDQDS